MQKIFFFLNCNPFQKTVNDTVEYCIYDSWGQKKLGTSEVLKRETASFIDVNVQRTLTKLSEGFMANEESYEARFLD